MKNKTQKIIVMIDPENLDIIKKASQLNGELYSAFVRRSSIKEARKILSENREGTK